MKAVIYARYSSDNQREESIEGQLRECKEYADKNGITILCSYIDRALSAKTDNRPEFQKMVQDSAKGLFDTVLVWKLDRFARNRYDSAHYKAVLRRNGVKVVSATENISDGPEGIILESMLEGMAEYYSAELAQKINRGLTENALKGKNNGGGIPLGYQLTDDQHLRIDPSTAPIVREIYQRYAEGETVRSIITSLNERHILTQKQKPFRPNSLHSVLCNRKYIGEYRYKDIIIPDGVPSIIPKDLFERVQMRVEKNKRTPARAKAEEEYLLTTKLFCGHCGRMMIGESGKSHTGAIYRYYKCSGAKRKLGCRKKAVKKDWIECIAVQYTIQRVFQDELIAQIADKLVEKAFSVLAVSIVIAGATIANLGGVPCSTLLTHLVSWRMAYALVACTGVVVIICVLIWVPKLPGLKHTGFLEQFRFLGSVQPWLIFLAIVLGNGGMFCWYSYVSPFLTGVSGLEPGKMTLVMAFAGAGMVLGNSLSGRLSVRFRPAVIAAGMQGVMAVSLLALFLLGTGLAAALCLLFLCTACLFGISAPQQMLLLQNARGGEMLGAAMAQVGFNTGNALGAFLGGLSIDAGFGYAGTACLGAAGAAVGFLLLFFYSRHEGR